MSSADNGAAPTGPAAFEKAIAATQSVASFDEDEMTPLRRVQHFLHANPTAIPAIVLVLAIVLFSAIAGSKFLHPFNFSLVLQQVTIIGIVGVAQTLIILTAGIDLSVGAIMVLSSVVMGKLAIDSGLPVPFAFGLGLLAGLVCGGINGGDRDAYLKFCHTLQKRIRQDKDRGIIALWHDESHINWYAFTHPHYRLLDASFCFFPGWDTVKPCYIYIRPKEEYFDVDAFKRDPPKTQLSPKVEKYNEFMLKAARKIQRHMPWLPRRKRE